MARGLHSLFGGEGRQTNNKRSAVVRVASMFFRGKLMFILLSGYLDDTARRGAGGERKAPCKQREKSTLLYVSPCRGLDAPTTARTVGLPPREG